MNYAARIELGHEHEFPLGELLVRPSVRQVANRTGRSEVVEPRVMQVLVALAQADGQILTREVLTGLCWDGRIVGEDAINRVMSRLRRLSEGIGGNSFRIETITKVGYRLVLASSAAIEQSDTASVQPGAGAARLTPTRRRVLTAGLLGSIGAIGAASFLSGRENKHVPSPEAARMMELGQAALCKCNAEGISEAIGLFRRAVELDPEAADAWGLLALAYAYALRDTGIASEDELRVRTRSTVARAFALDPHNPIAQEAIYSSIPFRGHWAEADQSYRTALSVHPKSEHLMFGYGRRLASVGRMEESARQLNEALRIGPPSPGLMFNQIWSVWGSGAIDEADRAIERAYSLFPLQTGIWFTRFYILMFSGRAREALNMGENVEGRPPIIRPESFELPMASARALSTHNPDDINHAMTLHLQAAHHAAGHAENAMHFASAIGRVNQAFGIAEAYFFNRGFVVPDLRFDGPQQGITGLSERQTVYLFLPPAQAMRQDQRFPALAKELGLTQFWRESGVGPDYKRG